MNKKVAIGIAVIVGALFLVKAYFSPLNTISDVLVRQRDYRDPNHFFLDASKFPTIGVSTETDVYKLLGADIDRRLTFKTTRKKEFNGKTFEYNKIIVYSDTYYTFSSERNEDVVVQGGVPLERSELVIYLLKGKVVYFAALNETRPTFEAEYQPTAKSMNLNNQGEAWPGSQQDIRDYYQENGMQYL